MFRPDFTRNTEGRTLVSQNEEHPVIYLSEGQVIDLALEHVIRSSLRTVGEKKIIRLTGLRAGMIDAYRDHFRRRTVRKEKGGAPFKTNIDGADIAYIVMENAPWEFVIERVRYEEYDEDRPTISDAPSSKRGKLQSSHQ